MVQAEFVGPGAEIGLLCNTSILENFNLAEAVGVRAIAEAGPVVQGEVPGMLDARALMHEWPAVDGGAEAAQDEQPPGIECLGGPATEQRPGVLPKQHPQPVAAPPGAGVTASLSVGVKQGHG